MIAAAWVWITGSVVAFSAIWFILLMGMLVAGSREDEWRAAEIRRIKRERRRR